MITLSPKGTAVVATGDIEVEFDGDLLNPGDPYSITFPGTGPQAAYAFVGDAAFTMATKTKVFGVYKGSSPYDVANQGLIWRNGNALFGNSCLYVAADAPPAPLPPGIPRLAAMIAATIVSGSGPLLTAANIAPDSETVFTIKYPGGDRKEKLFGLWCLDSAGAALLCQSLGATVSFGPVPDPPFLPYMVDGTLPLVRYISLNGKRALGGDFLSIPFTGPASDQIAAAIMALFTR